MEHLEVNVDFATDEEEIPIDHEERYVWIHRSDCKFTDDYVIVAESAIPPADCSFWPDDWCVE